MLKILKSIRNSFLISVLIIFNVSAKDIRLPKDVGSGNTYSKSLQKGFKKYGYEIVNKKDGHPVRAGDKSIRFELRNGDCGEDPGKWSDCESLRQRHELSGKRFRGKSWYAYSIYLPKDFKSVDPVKSAMAQFHQNGSATPFTLETVIFGPNCDFSGVTSWQNAFNNQRILTSVQFDSAVTFVAVTNFNGTFTSVPLNLTSYDNLLLRNDATNNNTGVTLTATLAQYTIAVSGAARTQLVTVQSWSINDAGGV